MSTTPMTTEEIGKNYVPQHVMELAQEPMYISEMARKLSTTELAMIGGSEGAIVKYKDVNHNEIVAAISKIVNGLKEGDRVRVHEVGYESHGGQEEASPLSDMEDEDGDTTWLPYTIVEATDDVDVRPEIEEVIDRNVTVDEKADVVGSISSVGNDISQTAEEIFQDVLRRQFRYFDDTEVPSYDDPGVDFYVNDSQQVDYGICYEISTRYNNPIGLSYMQSKDEKAADKDSDLVVMAPEFTKSVRAKYDSDEDITWRENPLMRSADIYHLPKDKPYQYQPFPDSPADDIDDHESGTPIIIPDSGRVRDMFRDSNHVSENYPIVDEGFGIHMEMLENVARDFEVVTESEYRLQIRENIEPSLWRLVNPYRVEQFLIDMYWDTGLRGGDMITQNYIGRLVDRTGGTIGEWMRRNRWDILTRGGGSKISEETIEIWKRMYKGEYPFPEEFSGYRIQAEYNRHPNFDLNDWEWWYQELSEDERQQTMTHQDSYKENLTYTVMMDNTERLLPSYSLIIQRLKDEGVEIRPADIAPRGLYPAYGSSKTLEYMINRDESTVASDVGSMGVLGAEEAEVFDSYLEVDVATWLSDNEIPYAHEPFTIPSMYGEPRDVYDTMVEMIRANGRRDVQGYEELQQEIANSDYDVLTNIVDDNGERVMLSELTPFQLRDEWNRIYDKHRLSEEAISPEVIESLASFQKEYILPDLVLYRNHDRTKVEQDWNDWDTWTEIVEVGGLWGVGVPDDADDEEWWTWYRVGSVAFKEIVYKLLGLWDSVYFLVPREVPIEGVSDGTPPALERDDNYIIFNSTQAELNLDDLADELGIFDRPIETGLTPAIPPTMYNRDLMGNQIEQQEVSYSGIDMSRVSTYDRTFNVGDGLVVYSGELGEVYLDGENAYVKESQFRHDSLIMLREYIADSLIVLYEEGVIEELSGV